MQTFIELAEQVFSVSAGNVDAEINKLAWVDGVAFRIWWNLILRKGFSHWWDGIEDDIKNEIFDELRGEIVKIIPESTK